MTDLQWAAGAETEAPRLMALESRSEHPLAEALVAHLTAAGIRTNEAPGEFTNHAGRGVTGRFAGREYCAGNRRLLEERGIAIDPGLDARARSRAAEAHSIVWFADEHRALAVAAVSDRLREGSREAVAELRRRGIEVRMLTGDQEASAAAVARAAGITRVKAGVLPGEKEAYIRDLQRGGHVVAMAGDGINDSAALARSDVGIALGDGSDIALEAARMTILSSDLRKIPAMLRLARLTVRTIRQNLFWAFAYNLVGVPVAAGVFYPLWGFLLDPMIAGAAMAMSSVSVVTNSLRLKRRRIEPIQNTQKHDTMERRFKVEGMMCGHCRAHVEKALNSIGGVSATVTLTPPEAVVAFTGSPLPPEEQQRTVTAQAGDNRLPELG